MPKVELHDYKGIEVARKSRPVTDEKVNEMIEALRETSAAMQPVEDRGAELGDAVTISVEGKFVENPEEEHIKQDDIEVTLGGKGLQQEFTDNLIGVKADDEKTFVVEYPADFQTAGLAGKKVEYTTRVIAVRVKELPDVDDEWARSIGEDFDSVETLRTRLHENMELQSSQEAEHRLRTDLMRKLLEGHQFEVPQSLVDHQTNFRLESVVRDMIGRGVDPRAQRLNWVDAREEMKTQAEQDVRGSLLLETIADEEKIDVSKEEIDAEIEAIARGSQQSVEQVRSVLTKDGGERSIASRLRNRKALDLLVANAQVTDEEWREETAEKEIRSQDSE